MERMAKLEAEKALVGEDFTGTLVSDRWCGYEERDFLSMGFGASLLIQTGKVLRWWASVRDGSRASSPPTTSPSVPSGRRSSGARAASAPGAPLAAPSSTASSPPSARSSSRAATRSPSSPRRWSPARTAKARSSRSAQLPTPIADQQPRAPIAEVPSFRAPREHLCPRQSRGNVESSAGVIRGPEQPSVQLAH